MVRASAFLVAPAYLARCYRFASNKGLPGLGGLTPAPVKGHIINESQIAKKKKNVHSIAEKLTR